ncbi:hypothetical protein [Asanoa sp. NPDC050611]|uniref:hypothetical protein n=1 Tax=Asanoa sp. NPDC050611 TaxID=3157098 RepID=UPI0033F31491
MATSPEPRAPRRSTRPVLLAAAAVLLLAGGAGYWWTRGEQTPAGSAPPPVTGTAPAIVDEDYEPPLPTAPEPYQVGLVLVTDQSGDYRVGGVAALFNGHFGSINDRNYPAAASWFDPSGVVDPTDPAAVARFAQDMSTTSDSDVVLRSVTSGPDVDTLLARVTFRSMQQAGYGPAERSTETCTDWDVTYVLRTAADGSYRIVRGTEVTSLPC